MQELILTPSTIAILALIAFGVVMAVRRMVKRGLCDCGDKCDSHGARGSHEGCSSCKACPFSGTERCKS